MSGDPALPRFVLLQVTRAAGAVMALAGGVILSHAQPALAHVPDIAGGALLVVGAVDFFLIPYALAKYWKRNA